ncbi:MAG TPA: two-component sensor histidine kinase, partial [Lachnospiraceae bacterium]|nr:two-component sensor histidine kinase [Lachnospiraceae bacterium]
MILLFVVGIVSALVVEIVVVQSYETRAINQRSVIVRNQCDLLVDQLVKRNFLENTGDEVVNGAINMLTSIYGGRILVMNGDSRVIMDSYNLDTG